MRIIYFFPILILFFSPGCSRDKRPSVVLYTSVDEPFARPIIKEFTRQTGIRVRTLFDTEASKTIGLARRLLTEKNNPRCDVFWNNEILQTITLKKKGLLAPYISPETKNNPMVRGPGNFYTFHGGRFRVFLSRSEKFLSRSKATTIASLKDPSLAGKASIALPLSGTSLTHAAVLFLIMGEKKAKAFFKAVRDNHTKIVQGNSMAKDLVVEGETSFCLTDTDDAIKGIQEDRELEIIVPDQGEKEMGALMVPGSIALIKDGPDKEEAKKLIDFLLSKKTVTMLLTEGAFQVPARNDVKKHADKYLPDSFKTIPVDWEKIYTVLPRAGKILREIFLR